MRYARSSCENRHSIGFPIFTSLFDTIVDVLISSQALKLAERTIQFADTLSLLTEGHIRAARVCHAKGDVQGAVRHYTAATKEPHPKMLLASIGLAQMHIKQGKPIATVVLTACSH